MKKSLTILFFLVAISAAIAQDLIVKNDATQLLYFGVSNPITVHVDHYKPTELIVKVSTGIITKSNNLGNYNWTICSSVHSYATIKIYCGKQFIKVVKFPIKRLPNPYCLAGNYVKGSRIPARPDLGNGLRAEWYDFVTDTPQVKSFNFYMRKLHYTGNRDTTFKVYNEGAIYNAEIRKLINSARPGDLILIENIKVQIGCEPYLRELNKLIYQYY